MLQLQLHSQRFGRRRQVKRQIELVLNLALPDRQLALQFVRLFFKQQAHGGDFFLGLLQQRLRIGLDDRLPQVQQRHQVLPRISGIDFAHQRRFAPVLRRVALTVGMQRAGQLAIDLAQNDFGVVLLLLGLELRRRGLFARPGRFALLLPGFHFLVVVLPAGAHQRLHALHRVE